MVSPPRTRSAYPAKRLTAASDHQMTVVRRRVVTPGWAGDDSVRAMNVYCRPDRQGCQDNATSGVSASRHLPEQFRSHWRAIRRFAARPG